MATKVIPLIPGKNQSLTCTLPVDNANLTLSFTLTYNAIGGYWYMSITNTKTQALLLDAVPLVPGIYPAANILANYSYLKIGSAWIVPKSQTASLSNPGSDNMGTDYVLLWSDTVN